ncbi:thermonuclease family protein, partial [Jannaschia donghaensis]|uniref:thermonuclease family protein n=1 Tax=Jannaschia donghaensis TaxID=420998 RepID=UPI0006D84282
GDQTCTDRTGVAIRCGALATAATRALYEGRMAECHVTATDRYDRALATCHVGGVDVNADLVRRGLARVYRDNRTYLNEQRDAKRNARGLWAYDMMDPAAWRAQRRAVRNTDDASAGPCSIKGNISDNGRIYHLPGDRYYARTRIAERSGERWFCSEADARAAGWRRTRS